MPEGILCADDEFTSLEESYLVVQGDLVNERVQDPDFFQYFIVYSASQIDNIDIFVVFLLHVGAEHVYKVTLKDIPCMNGIDADL